MAAGSSPIAIFDKDPAAVLDYTIDWSPWLKGDTLLGAVWTVPSGIANSGSASSSTTATIWLTGGTAGISYSVFVSVTTVGGRTDKRTIKINVVER